MNKNLSVTIIGKSGHASRIISIIRKTKGVSLKWVYYPKKTNSDELPLTNDFNKALECQAIIIASPTYTHADYLKRLQKFKGYILVEKPTVSTKKQSQVLKGYPIAWKRRVKVNYNFQYSKIAQTISTLTNSKLIGKVTSLSIWTSHGLAFTKKYKKSWRNNLKYSIGVLELVGVHYINLASNLFGPIKKWQADYTWQAMKRKELTPDTAWLTLTMENDVRINLYHSYAGPYFNRILLIGTNGYFDYDGEIAKLYSPRDCFDKKGRFNSPPMVKKYQMDYARIWKESLEDSVRDFFQIAKKRGSFPIDIFELALAAEEPIYQLKKRRR